MLNSEYITLYNAHNPIIVRFLWITYYKLVAQNESYFNYSPQFFLIFIV